MHRGHGFSLPSLLWLVPASESALHILTRSPCLRKPGAWQGLHALQAPGEAEALLGALQQAQLVDLCATVDGDVLLLGGDHVLGFPKLQVVPRSCPGYAQVVPGPGWCGRSCSEQLRALNRPSRHQLWVCVCMAGGVVWTGCAGCGCAEGLHCCEQQRHSHDTS